MYDDEKENRLIEKAQGGDPHAMEELLTKYQPAIKAAVRKVAPFINVEDAYQTASLRFIELVHNHDPARGHLTGRVKDEIQYALREESTLANSQFHIPARSQRRFLTFTKQAGGDVLKAAELAEAHGMARSTYFMISNVLTNSQSIDSNAEWMNMLYSDQEIIDLETNAMAHQALSCLDGDERYVVEAFYGFSEYREMSDAEIAHGLKKSKRQVRGMRQKALMKMRAQLGVIALAA